MTNPVIRPIPLSQLELSPENVRKTPASGNALTELTASIAAHGLIGSLVVQSPHPGPDGGRYPVIAGGRRLAALNALVRGDKLEPDYLVPCRVIDNAAIARELSLAENVVRSDMHPADQVEAFHNLARKGATAETIAERFGVTTRLVSQRLRLGGVDPALLTAYREERLSLETLTAFAITTDQAHQRAVWDQVKDQHHFAGAWQVKRMMTEDRVPAGARNARFVGIDVYEAAGGIVTRDLFAEDHEQGTWLDDPTLLNTLATAKLEAAADAIRPDWKWVDTTLDIDWQSLADYGRIDAIPGELTTEEQAEFERLASRHDELSDDASEDSWTDTLEDEYQTVTDRIAELEVIPDERATFPDELQPHAGVILTIHHDATLRTIKGLIRPGDKEAIEAASTAASDDNDTPAGFRLPACNARQPVANPEAEARKAAGLGNALCDDLRPIRTNIIKTHLAADFEAAFDLLLFQLARGVFTHGYRPRALDITINETPNRPHNRAGDTDFTIHNPGEAALEDHAALPLDWLKTRMTPNRSQRSQRSQPRPSSSSSPPVSPAAATASSPSSVAPGPSSRPPPRASTSTSPGGPGQAPRSSGHASPRPTSSRSPANISAMPGLTSTQRLRRATSPRPWKTPLPPPRRGSPPKQPTQPAPGSTPAFAPMTITRSRPPPTTQPTPRPRPKTTPRATSTPHQSTTPRTRPPTTPSRTRPMTSPATTAPPPRRQPRSRF